MPLPIKLHEDFVKEITAINHSYTIIGRYVNNATKIKVVDALGIEYLMHPKHMRSGSSPSIQSAIDKRLAFEILARKIHGNYYDYSQVLYKNANTKVDIICPVHGVFSQWANGHIRGNGCPKCNRFKPFTLTNFIKRSRGRMAILYLVEIFDNKESFIKIGTTFKTIKDRFYGETVLPYKYNTKDFLISDATTIYKLEKKAHKIMKSYKYTPIKHFGGDTECFQINGLTVALQLFKIEKASLKL